MHRQTLFLTLLSVVAMATSTLACSTHVSTSGFHQMYCDADLVFRGFQVGGSSSLAMDAQGREIQAGYTIFHATSVYKGSPADAPTIRVQHVWTEGVDPCPSGMFPDQGSDFLVFATLQGSAYHLDTCRHSFPWSGCVTNDFKQSLPNIHC